ncbi:MAG TPA: O-acetyl-ADP-ribose deacetylase [Myxococcaceae bacterium]|nr:O-acetyl-ADP-ribose deacetylase [Myxococcaceae bacterium]
MAKTLTIGDAVIELARGDITREQVDAIVNAANSGLMGGGGVDGAIHRAGGPSILEECKAIVERQGRCPTGQAVITGAGKLKARHVIHAVGPRFGRHSGKDADLLASAYRESLRLAADAGCVSVAFPAISTGAYGYPLEDAARVSIGVVRESLRTPTSIKRVRFVLFDDEALRAFERALG